MKIENSRGATPAGGARRAGAAPASGFTVNIGAAQRTTAAAGLSAVTSIDAVLALQGGEQPAQRRARQVRRGAAALDALEDLERGLVAGRARQGLLAQMEVLGCGAEPTGEAGLDHVLREIDTRLAVELAKLEQMRGIS